MHLVYQYTDKYFICKKYLDYHPAIHWVPFRIIMLCFPSAGIFVLTKCSAGNPILRFNSGRMRKTVFLKDEFTFT